MIKNKYKKEAEELIDYCKQNKLIIVYFDLGKRWRYSGGYLNKVHVRDCELDTVKRFNIFNKLKDEINISIKRLTFKELRKNCEPKSNQSKRWIVIEELKKIRTGWYEKSII